MSERPSPLPNRVTPAGEIVAASWRGTFFGNRGGRIHDDAFRIVRPWTNPRWICCVLEFRGRHREVMSDGYTELFFLDEACALAAGHRPCFQCRYRDYRRFIEAWARAHGGDPATLKVDPIDRQLQAERGPILRGKGERPLVTPATLPDGAMVADVAGQAYLCWRGSLRLWSGDGYRSGQRFDAGTYRLLTPPSYVAVLGAGYVPAVHPSADG